MRCVYALSSKYGYHGDVEKSTPMGIEYHVANNLDMTLGTPIMPSPVFLGNSDDALTILGAVPPPGTAVDHSMMGVNPSLDSLDDNANYPAQNSLDFFFGNPDDVSHPDATLEMSSAQLVPGTDVSGSNTPHLQRSLETVHGTLPSQQQAIALASAFFGAQHKLLPCIHEETFMSRLRLDVSLLSSSPLLWVLFALASSCNKSVQTQVLYEKWMQTANKILDGMADAPVSADCTSMLQASVWIVFEKYSRGHLTSAWTLLGRMSQLSSALGFNRIDSDRPSRQMLARLRECTDVEAEERRMSMWCLRLLDSIMGSINDYHFHLMISNSKSTSLFPKSSFSRLG